MHASMRYANESALLRCLTARPSVQQVPYHDPDYMLAWRARQASCLEPCIFRAWPSCAHSGVPQPDAKRSVEMQGGTYKAGRLLLHHEVMQDPSFRGNRKRCNYASGTHQSVVKFQAVGPLAAKW